MTRDSVKLKPVQADDLEPGRLAVWSKVLPAIVAALAAALLISVAIPPTDSPGKMHIQAFGKLPVVYQGRVKPYDTLARNALTIISEKQTYTDDAGNVHPAIKWLLDVISQSDNAMDAKVFRIPNPQVLDLLGLKERPGLRYAINEFNKPEVFKKLAEQVSRASQTPDAERDVFEKQVLQLASKIHLYRAITEAHSFPPIVRNPKPQELAAIRQAVSQIERQPVPYTIPPANANGQWRTFIRGVVDMMAQPDQEHPATKIFATMLLSYNQGDVSAFNDNLTQYQAQIRLTLPKWQLSKLDFEAWFNHFSPFFYCAILYVFAFLISAFAWLGFAGPLNRAAFWLVVLTAIVHTIALGARIYISGYPPVTNLYGTAIFIGWGCVLLGILLEWYYRMGVGNTLAAVMGFTTLLIAHFLAGDGDTLEMMRAVLDTKFWLATHVTTVTLGYTATFFAGFIALFYVIRGVFTPSLDKDTEKTFGRMIYGTLCFALLLSFVGTVLGGLWADDSWGRFWGWDPKENGALIIVLWNALILHARWGGMVKTRGIAALAIFGNIVVSWSWFGVNQLGIGLHSYGFISSIAFWLVMFVLSQLVMVAVAMIPRHLWRSARNFRKPDPRSTPDALPATP